MTTIPEPLVIASRGSMLALRQAEIVRERIRASGRDRDIRIEVVKTTGDKDLRPFAAIGGKGLFTAEVERALVDGRADVAVHSAKDLTAELAPGCTIVCVPEREAPADVIVGGEGGTGNERLGSLRPGARVGTSSMRRRALLAEARADLDAVELRGNLDTRLRKVEGGEVDAAVLAHSGLARIGRADRGAPLDPSWWVPAPGQGALAVEALVAREDLAELFAPFADPAASAEVACERAFAAALEGGCSVPLGCLARVDGGRLVATGFLGLPDGGEALRDRISGPPEQAEELGRELAAAILGAGGDAILAELREDEAPPITAP